MSLAIGAETEMKDLLILLAALAITWALCQIPFIGNLHDTSGSEFIWPPPVFEHGEEVGEWIEVCPYCGREMHKTQ